MVNTSRSNLMTAGPSLSHRSSHAYNTKENTGRLLNLSKLRRSGTSSPGRRGSSKDSSNFPIQTKTIAEFTSSTIIKPGASQSPVKAPANFNRELGIE